MNPTLALRFRPALSRLTRIPSSQRTSFRSVKRGFTQGTPAVNQIPQSTPRSEVDPSPSTGSNPALGSTHTDANSNGPLPAHDGPSTSSNPSHSTRSNSDPSSPSTHRNPPPPFPPGAYDPTVVEPSRISPLLAALLIGGLALTAYGVSDLWKSMTIWPEELRWDLRHGLRENAKGDKAQAELYLGQAWDRARAMDIEKLGNDAYLKTTGIAIALAGIYESDGKLSDAYRVLIEALQHLQRGPPSPSGATKKQRVDMEPATTMEDIVSKVAFGSLRSNLSQAERMRAVAISYKLSELAEELGVPKDEEEKWLVYTVETVLKHVMQRSGVAEVVVQEKDPKTGQIVEESADVFEQLELPRWVLKHDLAAPFEALGAFYARSGNINYAMPLYLQAIAILIPPPPQVSSADDQCRASQIMANISELILRASTPPDSPTPPPEALRQAESWASKAMEVAARVRKGSFMTHSVCEYAYAFALFNLGSIKEMSGNETEAKELYARTLEHSRAIGFEEGIVNAKDALKNAGKRPFGVASDASLDVGDAAVGSMSKKVTIL
ncbi:hypothetical protein BKA70DRAFT_1554198 [Coprinopsis sp. MPI-PUGE-AT-0042]|nr:hypothetical protein BKA70DRAFT_1554198 [Coprinopsis sp. MPI-PUGE-AT-0042]